MTSGEPMIGIPFKVVKAARTRSQGVSHAAAVQQIADPAGIDWKHAEEILDTLEAPPTVIQELLPAADRASVAGGAAEGAGS